MERRLYQLTERQQRLPTTVTLPSDDHYKAMAKKSRKPWGLLKRADALRTLRLTRDYKAGQWQGYVDAARGTGYSEERFSEAYNLGYHEGYTHYESHRWGWDDATRERFEAEYLN